MIIIAGDSWACGEWVIDKEQLSHGGLYQYLHDHGYPVINLGTPAGSNAQTINKLNHFFLANGAMKHQIQSVIVIRSTNDFEVDCPPDLPIWCTEHT